MITLACETSTLLGSVAILDGDRVLVEKSSMRQGSHSDTLHPIIQDCLRETNLSLQQIDSFATGLGPGSFTGIRISLNTIKTYSYIQKKPCLGLDTLSNIALRAQQSFAKDETLVKVVQDSLVQTHQIPLVVIVNAFKNMVYAARFVWTPKELIARGQPEALHVRDLVQKTTEPVLCLGDGYSAYETYFKKIASDTGRNFFLRQSEISDFPIASMIHEKSKFVKKMNWPDLLPIYLRASEAEENLQGIKFSPL